MNFKKIISTVFPTGYSCMNCGCEIFDTKTYLCADCEKSLPFLKGNLCLHCNEPITGSGKYCLHCKGKKFECGKIISPFEYDGIVKKFIVGLKYENKKYFADCLSTFMATSFLKELLPCDIVTCVPLCDKRFKERGYNQADILASQFANKINIEYNPNLLKRVKDTPTQTKLSQTDRKKNMIDAFKVVDKKLVKDKIIVLVDDVYTTGATTSECAKKLNKAGAKCVYAVTAGHTLLK